MKTIRLLCIIFVYEKIRDTSIFLAGMSCGAFEDFS